MRANLKSISHRCHVFEVAFVWKLTKETMQLPLGCLQGGCAAWWRGSTRNGHLHHFDLCGRSPLAVCGDLWRMNSQKRGSAVNTLPDGCEEAATLEATQVQIDGFFSQLPYKCHQNRVASVGD